MSVVHSLRDGADRGLAPRGRCAHRVARTRRNVDAAPSASKNGRSCVAMGMCW